MRRKIIFGVIILVDMLLLGVALFIGFDSKLGVNAAAVANITIPAEDGTPINAYLALPERSPDLSQLPPETYPAVIMIHEWWGLNAEIPEMAEILAAEGYVVLAVDTYRGDVAETVPGAIFLRVTVPTDRVDRDVQAAYDYLAGLPNVDADRIAILGFCYGGGVALRHGTQNPNIAAVVNLYGDTIDSPDGFGTLLDLDAPVLGIFGAEDAQIPLSEVEAFETALDAAEIPHTVTVYPGVGHAFVYPESIAEAGAAQDAWAEILAFFDMTLQASADE